MRTFSNGGGVQSTAALVLSAKGIIEYPVHIFANVGGDSEHPDVLRYMHEIAMPYARKNGIELLEIYRTMKRGKRAGERETIYGRIYRTRESVPIPAYRSGGYPLRHTCSIDFKVRVIIEWLKEHGATKENPVISGIGYSTDEWSRLKKPYSDIQKLEHPLMQLRLSRSDCIKIIRDAGLPIPRKSACWFCPVTSPQEWIEMYETNPELFERACELEEKISRKAGEPLYLHRMRVPLMTAVRQYKMDFLELEKDTQDCIGYCMT